MSDEPSSGESDGYPSDDMFHDEVDITRDGLKYYIFDWDDNILHMPTKIVLERRGDNETWSPHEVSTSMFALIRHDTENFRPPNGDWEGAFANFRDLHERGESSFLTDTKAALQPVLDGDQSGAPSFHVFRDALIKGRLFAIVTARGHKPESIRAAVEYFIDKVLTEDERAEMIQNLRAYREAFGFVTDPTPTDDEVLGEYLALNRYHGVTSPEFRDLVLLKEGDGAESPEQAKQLAIKDFVDHVLGIAKDGRLDRKISVGFSDDDVKNIKAAQSFIEGYLAKEYPYVTFVVYDTSDRGRPSGKKMVLQGQLELGLGDEQD